MGTSKSTGKRPKKQPGTIIETKGTIGELWTGFATMFRGIGLFFSHPTLWPRAIIPALVNIAIGILVMWRLYNEFSLWMTETFIDWEGWLWGSLAYFLGFLAFAFVGAVFVLLYYVFLMILGPRVCSPFNDILSERVEVLLHQEELEKGDSSVSEVLGQAASGVVEWTKITALEVVVTVPLVIIGLFLGPFGIVLIFPAAVYFAALNFLDLSMARRRFKFGEKLALMRRYRARTMGFGLAVASMLSIPWVSVITNLVTIPLAAVGGTILFAELPDKSGGPSSKEGT